MASLNQKLSDFFSMYIPHANTVHMSHQGLSGTSVGPHTTFLLPFQDSITVCCPIHILHLFYTPTWGVVIAVAHGELFPRVCVGILCYLDTKHWWE